MKPSIRIISLTGVLLALTSLLIPLLFATPARIDERDEIIKDIEAKLESMTRNIKDLANSSSSDGIKSALDDADKVKSRISDLNGVKGDDAKANNMVSQYPGYVDKFRDAAAALKQLKDEQLALKQDNLVSDCEAAQSKIKDAISDHQNKDPDDRNIEVLREQANNIAQPIRERSIRAISLLPSMKDLRQKARDFTVRDGGWNYVSDAMSSSGDSIFDSWAANRELVIKACGQVKEGQRNPDVVKATLGNCSESDWKTLNRTKGETCDNQNCEKTQECSVLKEIRSRLMACIDARKAIMDTCYDGGDARHKDVLGRIQERVNTCDDLIKPESGICK